MGKEVKRLEKEILPTYLPACRWYGGKGRVMRELKITQNVPLGADPAATRILVVEVIYAEGLPDSYVLPGDSEDALAARVLEQEHKIYPQALRLVAEGKARI